MNIDPLLSEAERALVERDVDRAAAYFASAEEQCAGRSPAPALGLARIAILLQRFEDARVVLDDVIAKFPKCAEALTFRGVIEESAGRLHEALGLHARALTLDPTLGTAHANLGRTQALLHHWDLAAASYQLAVQHGATEPELKVQLGTALFRAQRTNEALKVLALTVKTHPRHLDALLTLADMLVETSALQLAADLLDNAVYRFPDVPLIAARRAVVALKQKDLEAAGREAWRHTKLAPKDEEAWLFAAVVDTMQLRFDTAERALRTVLKLNPRNARAHYHLGGLFDAVQDKAAAKRAYRSAIDCDPLAWEPLNNLSVMLLEEGTPSSLQEARSVLERAVRLGARGDAIAIRYNLVLACHRLGDAAGARRAAQELAKVTPLDHPMALEAHRVLRLAA